MKRRLAIAGLVLLGCGAPLALADPVQLEPPVVVLQPRLAVMLA